jgi:hypothetical protein
MTTTGAPSPRAYHAAGIIGNTYAVFGGSPTTATGSSSTATTALSDGGLYDLGTDTWSPIPTLQAGRCNHQAVSTGSGILTFGGLSNCANGSTTGPALEELTIGTAGSQWTTISTTNQPTLRYNFSSIWTGQGMFIIGGGSNSGPTLSDEAVYVPGTGWLPASCNLSSCESWTNPLLFMRSGMVYSAWGGFPTWSSGTGVTIDPLHDVWQSWAQPADPGGRAGTVYAASSDRVFFLGSNKVTMLDISTLAWLADDTSPFVTGFCYMGADAVEWSGSEVVVWGGQCSDGVSTVGGRYQPPAR